MQKEQTEQNHISSEAVLLDSYNPTPFEAIISHKSGAKVYKTDQNELFCVVVLSKDEYQRASLLCAELKENGSPVKFEDAVEKVVIDGLKSNLRSVEYTLNNKRRVEFVKQEEKLRSTYLNMKDEKHFDPTTYASRLNEVRTKLKIGSTQVDMS